MQTIMKILCIKNMNIIDYFYHILLAIFNPNSLLENSVKDYKELETSYDKLVIEHADEVEENTALRMKLERYYKTGKNS